MIIDAAIQEAIADVIDRGAEDEKPRKVVIELELRKIRKEPNVFAAIKAQAKLPPRQGPTTHAMEMGEDKLFFSPRFAHEPDQAELEFDPELAAEHDPGRKGV